MCFPCAKGSTFTNHKASASHLLNLAWVANQILGDPFAYVSANNKDGFALPTLTL